jgi:hypothetical protein
MLSMESGLAGVGERDGAGVSVGVAVESTGVEVFGAAAGSTAIWVAVGGGVGGVLPAQAARSATPARSKTNFVFVVRFTFLISLVIRWCVPCENYA